MSGGGGGGSSTTTQSIAPELRPLASAYTAKAIDLGNQGFRPYTAQRFAQLDPTQTAGLDMIQNRALRGSATMNQAEGALGQMMQGGPNPYLDAMVNKAQGNVLSNANAAAARSGSFGNSGIAEAAAKQMGDVATSMYGGAYEGDQARRLQAIGMAPTFGNAAYQDGQQLLNAGQIKQDQHQQGLDYLYQQHQQSEALPYQQLASMAGVFGSQPYGASSTTSQSGGGK